MWSEFELGEWKGPGMRKATCKHCGVIWQAMTATRARFHMTGGSTDIPVCRKVTTVVSNRYRKNPLSEESPHESAAIERTIAEGSSSLGSGGGVTQKGKVLVQTRLYDGKNPLAIEEEARQSFARAMYACGVPFNVLKNPFMQEALKAIAVAGHVRKGSFKPPTYDEVRESMLAKEVRLVEQELDEVLAKDRAAYGVVITSDGWTNIQNRPIINVMSVCKGAAKFETSIDASGESKTGEYIAGVVGDVIRKVGEKDVVGVVMDGAANCKLAMRLLKVEFPHITTTVCTAHVVDLAFEDVGKVEWVRELVREGHAVVNYVLGHEKPQAVFRKYSEHQLIKHVPTRFGTNYIVLKRLMKVLLPLRQSVFDATWVAYANSAGGRYKELEAEVKAIILDEEYERKVRALLAIIDRKSVV